MIVISRRKKNSRTFFTRTRQRIIYEALRKNLPLTRAAELADISYSAFRQWMVKGRDPHRSYYNRFRRKVKKILAEREKEALQVIRAAGIGGDRIVERKIVNGPRGKETTIYKKRTQRDWKAASRYLELVAPEIYGQKTKFKIHDEDEVPEKHNLTVEGQLEANVRKPSVLNHLRQLDGEEIEELACILRKIEQSKQLSS